MMTIDNERFLDSLSPAELEKTSLSGAIQDIEPITIMLVENKDWQDVWKELVGEYHYLGHKRMPGRRVKYLAFSGEQPIAAFGFRAASLNLEVRDCFIGWSYEQRKAHLHRVVNNNRFVIFPWVSVDNLGSYLLGRVTKRLPGDWRAKYGCEPLLLETFIDPDRFDGTVYAAANWIYVGETKGYTKKRDTFTYHGHRKEVLVYPLKEDFRDIIGCQQDSFRRRYSFRRERLRVLNHGMDWHPDVLESVGITENNNEEVVANLEAYHRCFGPCFSREKQQFYSLIYLKGLLSDLPKKCVESIALRYLGEDQVRALQRFLTDSPCDDRTMVKIHQERAVEMLERPDGMISIDASGFVKKGTKSVAVKRQYCSRLGKVENCQIGVFAGYASDAGYSLLDCQLYMPQEWFSDEYAERRQECRVPEDLEFMTQQEIALLLLDQMDHLDARWIGVDCTFGDDPKFRDKVGEDYLYLAGISCDTRVWLERPKMEVPPYKGRGRPPSKERPSIEPVRVDEIAKSESTQWKQYALNQGAKGYILADVARVRVVEYRDGTPGKDLWLIMRRYKNGQIKYYLSNAPEDTPMEVFLKALTMRWPIEQCFEFDKSELGMADYEFRSWTAWHRHMIHVMVAMQFVVEMQQEMKESPSAEENEAGSTSSTQSTEEKESRKPVLSLVKVKEMVTDALNSVHEWATSFSERMEYHKRRNAAAAASRYEKQRRELKQAGLFIQGAFTLIGKYG